MKRRNDDHFDPDHPAINGHLKVTAIKILRSRGAFKDTLPKGFVYDPALEILLFLYVDGPSRVSRSALDAAVSSNTAHWIRALAREGLVDACPDAVGLSRKGAQTIEESLELVLDRQMEVR